MPKIAYVPVAPDLYQGLHSQSALDRRRLAALIPYWEQQGFEVVPWQPGLTCDLVYIVSLAHSLALASRLAGRPRQYAVVGNVIEDPFYVFYADYSSDDLAELQRASRFGPGLKGWLRRLRRGLGYMGLAHDPTVSLFRVIRQCDGIITTSEAQAVMVRQLNLFSCSIADCMPVSDFGGRLCEYEQHTPLTLVWEGTGWGLQLIELIRPALEAVHTRAAQPVEFLFVGPRERPQPLFGLRDNREILASRYRLPARQVDWSLATMGGLLAGAAVGLAPMPLHNPFYLNKAYSKPLSYMACGLPVVASPIPSYRELIREGVDGLLAATVEEWTEALLRLVASPELRRQLGLAGRQRLLESHSEEIVAKKFAGVFTEAIRLNRYKST